MIDHLLNLFEDEEITGAATSKVLDSGQESPNTGLSGAYIQVFVKESFAGATSVTFEYQDSANGTAFAEVLSVTYPVSELVAGANITLHSPYNDRRYTQLVVTPTPDATAGKISAYVGYGAAFNEPREANVGR